MDNLELFESVSVMLSSLVETRKVYQYFVDTIDDKTYTEEERYEAYELTKGGMYKYMNRIQTMAEGGQ